MNNPNGPYPGRQLFLGLTVENNPCFAYLITGRSPESRERKAVPFENTIRIGPLGNVPYDALRHYSAVKYDNTNGIAAVTNGIQTEAVFETYKLIFNTGNTPGKDYIEKIMEGAGSEPDSLHTPRIASIITNSADGSPVFIACLKVLDYPAKAWQIKPEPGTMTGVSTYKGEIEKPEANNPQAALPKLEFKGKTAEEAAGFLFDISAVSYKGNDIRVCTVGGVRFKNQWKIAVKNTH
jgi:IMP cyclohydrolase